MTEIEGQELLYDDATPVPVKGLRRRLSLFNRVMFVLNIIASVLLLFSFLSPYVSPAIFWPVAFLGLGLLPLIFVNLLFTVYWLVQWRRHAWLPILALVSALPSSWSYYRVQLSANPVPPGKKSFTVLSYNTKLFDLYNWSHNLETRSRMFDLMRSQHPDILCLQEFYNEDTGALRNLDTLRKLMNFDTVDAEYSISLRKTDHWGIATFSKWPIINSGKIVFNNRSNNLCIYTDILMNGDTVRVYNMHLQSIHFGYADYNFLHKLEKGEDTDDDIENSKNILRRLKSAFTRRAGQAESIRQHIDSCRYPVIVCGDFNDTPNSYAVHTISENLQDAFLESGNGIGQSFVNSWPLPRIDYILHSKRFGATDFMVLPEVLSDHYPIVCKMWVK